jgi:hypothetical protein
MECSVDIGVERRVARLPADDRRLRPRPCPRPARAGRRGAGHKSVELGVRGRSDEAIEAYQRVIDATPRPRPHSARAGRPCA